MKEKCKKGRMDRRRKERRNQVGFEFFDLFDGVGHQTR